MLILQEQRAVFDTTAIFPGDFIRFEYLGASEPRNGLVRSVSENMIGAIYSTNSGNGTAAVEIASEEVKAGRWKIQWSTDLKEIKSEGEDVV